MLKEERKKEILSQISNTLKFMNNSLTKSFSDTCQMYSLTTENISAYLKKIDLTNKKVLTVTSSGDHMLNMAFQDCKKIDCFDLNKNAYFMQELKIASIKKLDYEEFLDFFTDCERIETVPDYLSYHRKIEENPNAFNFEQYKLIRENLKEEIKFYWGCDKIIMDRLIRGKMLDFAKCRKREADFPFPRSSVQWKMKNSSNTWGRPRMLSGSSRPR